MFALLAVWIGGVAGCKDDGKSGAESKEIEPIVKSAERGPVKMTVTADKSEITIAERLTLTIEVVAAEGVDVTMPEFGQELTQFVIRDFRDFPAEPFDGGRRWRQVYDLDVFLSGTYAVPGLTAQFIDRRKGHDAVIEGRLSTEGFEVTVASLLEGEFDPRAYNDIKGPVELPVDRTWAWAWWTGGGLAGAALMTAAIIWFMRRRRRAKAVEIVIPPHEWAFDQLQALIDEQLVENGRINEFYFRLSMIVRRYIELRYGMTAPEWTTEEFLVNVQRSDALSPEHRGMLGEFLQACDMVKFALYVPANSEIEQAFNAARDFVSQTTAAESAKVAA